MGSISIIDPTIDPRWNAFVDAHPYGALCHKSGWKIVLENSFPQMKGYYIVLEENNYIQAALPLYFVQSFVLGDRYVSIPFATICDPLITQKDQMKNLIDYLFDHFDDLKKLNIEYRAYLSSPEIQDVRFHKEVNYKIHYLSLDRDPEKVKSKFDRTCVIQKISRGLKNNLILKKENKSGLINEYYRLYTMTRRRLGLPLQPKRFFENLWNVFASTNNLEILFAYNGEIAIGALLLLKHKKVISAEYLGYDHAYLNSNPNHFLLWHAIQDACINGYEMFDFGRTEISNEGLMKFKRHWGTLEKDLPIYYSIEHPKRKTFFVNSSVSTKIISPFIRYGPECLVKHISNYIYRHLG